MIKEPKMKKQHALEALSQLKPELIKRFGVTRLALFGSTVRDEASEGSDIDIIISFGGVATSKQYFGAQFLLEDTLGQPIDLVTENALRPELKTIIENEAVNV